MLPHGFGADLKTQMDRTVTARRGWIFVFQ
jgi:hypothetical protein